MDQGLISTIETLGPIGHKTKSLRIYQTLSKFRDLIDTKQRLNL